MPDNGIAPGCVRITFDVPTSLQQKAKERASKPPVPISLAEYCRRILAHHLNYPLPPRSLRRLERTRIDGIERGKPGPKRKVKIGPINVEAQQGECCEVS